MSQPDTNISPAHIWRRSDLATQDGVYRVTWELQGGGIILSTDKDGVKIFASSRWFSETDVGLLVHQLREAGRFHAAFRDGRPIL